MFLCRRRPSRVGFVEELPDWMGVEVALVKRFIGRFPDRFSSVQRPCSYGARGSHPSILEGFAAISGWRIPVWSRASRCFAALLAAPMGSYERSSCPAREVPLLSRILWLKSGTSCSRPSTLLGRGPSISGIRLGASSAPPLAGSGVDDSWV